MTCSHDRAAGVLLGQACGDALGVPYEFGPALPDSFTPVMAGGGPFGFAPGEYSDDTSMAVCIAEVARTGADLTTDAALDEIAERFLAWAAVAKDVGSQTRAVFGHTHRSRGPRGAAMLAASREHAAAHPGRVGNGALMRTAIVGLTDLGDRDATAAAARAVAELTHADPLGAESCVLWSEAVRLAVTSGRLDLLAGLDLLPEARRDQWRAWIDAATGVDPRTFARNGFTVHAEDNPHLEHVLADTAAAIKALRDEGKTVFVHCVAAQQRTPSVGVAYSRLLGVPAGQAQDDMRRALPGLRGHGPLWDAAARVTPRQS